MSYSIVVITKVPSDSGNMALASDLYIETDEPDPKWNGALNKVRSVFGDAGQVPLLPLDLLLKLRAPVFSLGEILFLDPGTDREIIYPGRKPNKWDVEVEYFDTIDEALVKSREVTEAELEADRAARAAAKAEQ